MDPRSPETDKTTRAPRWRGPGDDARELVQRAELLNASRTARSVERQEEIERAYLVAAADRARRTLIALARKDPMTFAELVLRDEETGEPIENARVHERLHELWATFPRLILWSFPELGKTAQLVARIVWELGRDPTLRIVVCSRTYTQAERIVRAARDLISGGTAEAEIVRAIFPKLRPGPKWTDGQWTVRRDFVSKTPSVQAIGVHGAVTGQRVDLFIGDDIVDHETTRTPSARRELLAWFEKSIPNRLSARGRIWLSQNAWHPEDLAHVLARRPGWTGVKIPVLDEKGAPTYPERFPMARVKTIRDELSSVEFARMYLCKARDESSARFSEAWVRRCLREGDGLRLVSRVDPDRLPPDAFVVTGVDLATGRRKDRGDLTVFFTILVDARTERKRILEIVSGRWRAPEILRRAADVHERFGSVLFVEDNAAQVYLLQVAARDFPRLPVRGLTTTGARKWHPAFGVESLAGELERGEWLIPNEGSAVAPEVDAWIAELLSFDPATHTGDRLIASWIAREGARRILRARRAKARAGRGGARVIGGRKRDAGEGESSV